MRYEDHKILSNEDGLFDVQIERSRSKYYLKFKDKLYDYFYLNSFKDKKDVKKGLDADRFFDVQKYVSKMSHSPIGLITIIFREGHKWDSESAWSPYHTHFCKYTIMISVTMDMQEEMKEDFQKLHGDWAHLPEEDQSDIITTTDAGQLAESRMDLLMGDVLKMIKQLPFVDYLGFWKVASNLEWDRFSKVPIFYDGSEYVLQSKIEITLRIVEEFDIERNYEEKKGLFTNITGFPINEDQRGN